MRVRSVMDTGARADWRRNRRLVRQGFKDLEYLPRSRTGWNATMAAHAYALRRKVAGAADLNLWAAMQGCSASARYQELGRSARCAGGADRSEVG